MRAACLVLGTQCCQWCVPFSSSSPTVLTLGHHPQVHGMGRRHIPVWGLQHLPAPEGSMGPSPSLW